MEEDNSGRSATPTLRTISRLLFLYLSSSSTLGCPPAVSITAYSRLITAPPRPFKCRGPSFFATLDHDLFWLSPDSPPVPGSVRLQRVPGLNVEFESSPV